MKNKRAKQMLCDVMSRKMGERVEFGLVNLVFCNPVVSYPNGVQIEEVLFKPYFKSASGSVNSSVKKTVIRVFSSSGVQLRSNTVHRRLTELERCCLSLFAGRNMIFTT